MLTIVTKNPNLHVLYLLDSFSWVLHLKNSFLGSTGNGRRCRRRDLQILSYGPCKLHLVQTVRSGGRD